MSTTSDEGFNTVNLVVDQRTTGFESESALYLTGGLRVEATLGFLAVDVERQGGVEPVAPLTPKLTLSVSPNIVERQRAARRFLPESTTPTAPRCGANRVPTAVG